MRRLGLLLPLVLVGCGGSSADRSAAPFFVVRRTSVPDQDVVAGFDASDAPMGIVYDDRTQNARVATPSGSRTIALAGRNVSFGVEMDAGYASFYTSDNEILLLDVATGATQTVDFGAIVATDGSRTVVTDGASDTLMDLKTGTRTPLPVPSGKSVWLLSGDIVLLIHDEGPLPGTNTGALAWRKAKKTTRVARPADDTGPVPHYDSFSLETLAGTPIADLAMPPGMTYGWVMAINDSGEAVGFTYPALDDKNPALVRWDRSGKPTVLLAKGNVDGAVAITRNGRVFATDLNSQGIAIDRDGTTRKVPLDVLAGDQVQYSKDGRKAMAFASGPGVARFYRLP